MSIMFRNQYTAGNLLGPTKSLTTTSLGSFFWICIWFWDPPVQHSAWRQKRDVSLSDSWFLNLNDSESSYVMAWILNLNSWVTSFVMLVWNQNHGFDSSIHVKVTQTTLRCQSQKSTQITLRIKVMFIFSKNSLSNNISFVSDICQGQR